MAPSPTFVIRQPMWRYALALGTVAAFLGLRSLLDPLLGNDAPMATLTLAILISAWFGGKGPGLLATVILTLTSAYAYLQPSHSLQVLDPGELTRLSIFFVQGVVISLVIDVLQSLRGKADASAKLVHRQKEELAASEHQFREFFEASTVGMVKIDLDTGTFLHVNAAFCDVFGYNPDELTVLTAGSLAHADDRPIVRDAWSKLRQSGQITQLECRFIHKTGRVGWCSASGRVLTTPDRGPRMIGVVHDVTEKHAAAEELRGARDAAEAASRAKTQFLANMSHEIRTPLGVILGFTDFLLEPGNTAAEAAEQARVIKRNGEQLFQIVNELLDVSKVEAGKLTIETIAFDLQDFLAEATSLLRFKAEEKGLALRLESLGKLPEVVATDPSRLRQILLNVVGNAVKFTERGVVDIAVRTHRDLGNGRDDGGAGRRLTLEFLVSDSGIGLTDEQRGRIFQPFVQGDDSMTRRFGGAGLGLYLSRRLARLLGGDLVLVDSSPGLGSTFRITVSAEDSSAPQVAPETAGANAPDSVASTRVAPRLENVKVLLVEDAADNRILIGKMLRAHGAEVDLAVDGIDGVEKALNAVHDVILMDMQMPRLDGLEAVARLRQAGYERPIVALTAHAFREDRERCLKAGCNDYMSKPMDINSLVTKLQHLSQTSPTSRADSFTES